MGDSTRLMEGLRRKLAESRSLFQREGEKHVVHAYRVRGFDVAMAWG